MTSAAHERDLDPDQIDRLLSNLEQELEKMPSDNPTSQELKLEIETLRAMLASRNAENGWSSDENNTVRAALQKITERLKGNTVTVNDNPSFVKKIERILGFG